MRLRTLAPLVPGTALAALGIGCVWYSRRIESKAWALYDALGDLDRECARNGVELPRELARTKHACDVERRFRAGLPGVAAGADGLKLVDALTLLVLVAFFVALLFAIAWVAAPFVGVK